MSESLLPWICNYLITVAEEFGANASAAPVVTRKKKVQIIEFLTYGNEDSAIWARISDKQYLVPMRFSRESVAAYTKLSGKRLTQHKTAVIVIDEFKLLFARVPLGSVQRMSSQPYLALECNSFSVLGSIGEARFGNPKSIEMNPDLKAWSDGLKQDGGAGNILKDRKAEREQGEKELLTTKEPMEHALSTTKPQKEPKKPQKRVANEQPTKQTTHIIEDQEQLTRRVYEQRWRLIAKDPEFQRPSEELMRVLKTIPARGENNESRKRVVAIEASKSPSPKRRRLSPFEHQVPDVDDPPPTSSPERFISDWEASPSPVHVEARVSPEDDRKDNEKQYNVPLSSPEPELSLMAPETVLPSDGASVVMASHPRRSVMRRVPRPNSPRPLKNNEGPARILAPNSDTSGTASQSLLSQSQSQIQHLASSYPIQALPLKDTELDRDMDSNLLFSCPNREEGFDGADKSPLRGRVNDEIRDHSPILGDTNDRHDKETKTQRRPGNSEAPKATSPTQLEVGLEEDDEQIHRKLFKGSESSTATERGSTHQTSICPNAEGITKLSFRHTNGIQHDAKAWKAPSFLKTKNTEVPAPRNSTHGGLRRSSRSADKEIRIGKRAEGVELIKSGRSGGVVKKLDRRRRDERTDDINCGDQSREVPHTTEVGDAVRKLGGFSVNMEEIRVEDSKLPWVDWYQIKGILAETISLR